MKSFIEFITEVKKTNLKDVVAILSNEDDWGDMKDTIKIVKGKLRIVDTYFYGADKAMQSLRDGWTSKDGVYAKFFKDEYGIEFKLEDEFEQEQAEKEFKKITKDGIVGIFVSIK